MGKQNCELAHNFSSFYFKSETIQPETGLNINLSIEKTTDASFSGNVSCRIYSSWFRNFSCNFVFGS